MKPRQPQHQSSMESGNSATPHATEYATMQETSTPVLASPPPRDTTRQGKSARLGCLQFIDSRQWHYFFMLLLFMDFFGNCVAVSFTSTENFYKYGPKTRIASLGFCGVYVVDMFLRLISLRTGLFRNAASVGDLMALVILLVALGGRIWKADDVNKVKITMGGWTNSYKIAHEYNSNQIEMYIDAVYCFFVAVRIVLKPRARTFSKKLHKHANHDHLRISMASLRSSIRRIPGITAAAVEVMETDLAIICGRNEGDMSRGELMQFLQKALLYRPKELSANAFLAHLRDIDAMAAHAVYGAYDVVKSTFRHWSNQRVDLALTTLVVIVFACITPVLAFFLKIVTDEAFPKYVYSTENFDFVNGQTKLMGIFVRPSYKNETPNENNTIVELPFTAQNSLILGIVGLVGISIPFILCDYAMGYFQSKMIANATQRLQNSLLRILLNKPTKFFQERTDGDLNNLFQSDISRVNAMWQAVFWNLMQPIVAIVIGFGYLLYFDPIIGIMSFSFSAIIATSGPQGLAGDKSQDFGKKSAYVSAEFQNAIACQKVVRAYEIQAPLLARFATSIRTLKFAQFAKDFWSGIVQIYIESAMFIFVSVMTACLAIKVYFGNITAGDFFASVTMLSRVSTPVTVLGGFMRVAISNASSLQRLDAIVMERDDEYQKEMKKDCAKPTLPRMSKSLALSHVNFSYVPGEKMNLSDITTVIKQGEYVCVVGPSGCGKSTLLSCLMQFQSISSGSIAVDGLDTQLYSKASFADQTAVVFQDGGILNGTIMENILYGHPRATEQDCMDAAKAAECDAFIHQLKDGYQTIIGQHGTTNLSGGQVQRICLARALVRKPSLLLLDEATSALDPETEANVVATLERLARKMHVTIISVTHRLSTTRNADLILVLNDGKIVETGTYKDLMQSPGSFFAEMVHKTDDSAAGGRPGSRNSSFVGFVVEDLGNVLDTHRALNEFQHKLSNRSGENGAIMSAWQVRKLSSGRQMSRGASQNGSVLANLPSRSSQDDQDRDSYLVL
ncbi:hypothetical protein, variant 2 [Aphanomyces invadans]|uniref:ABC transporter domain-containing protein n=1 Tax=Aphanomyces invadans TaxID=157072 RepID=A0A024TCP2_9STRA|nr:hypothetical protein H310_14038 [Aphanomyces invadans]XP_008879985.1 hypothetical protein, variant 1 [Aphanomyces invadans]XP_008879986.1 hypothetical protein, variant 2 [Aphanomyces invadans]ETV91356.1 hypothetical protein H310_14038 [Aphanomyces invadans]ETV91357.1 hypothetical protein, variant 1 [Aphanomyces invadans]ETV91358.1 hypothetical protein, variant 2 [Aphanomyces invadans]|eukprot:XP_008879984.1 hypothetical protein H310_14038 [Aphanomyces invadans]